MQRMNVDLGQSAESSIQAALIMVNEWLIFYF